MDPFSKFVAQRMNPSIGAGYHPAPGGVGPNQLITQAVKAAYSPPVYSQPYGPPAPPPAYQGAGNYQGSVDPFADFSAGQMIQLRQDAAANQLAQTGPLVQKQAQDKAISDAAIAAAYQQSPGLGGVPPLQSQPIPRTTTTVLTPDQVKAGQDAADAKAIRDAAVAAAYKDSSIGGAQSGSGGLLPAQPNFAPDALSQSRAEGARSWFRDLGAEGRTVSD